MTVSGESSLTRFVYASAGPVRLLLAVIIFAIAVRSVGVAVVVRYYSTFLNQIVGVLAIAWLNTGASERAVPLLVADPELRTDPELRLALGMAYKALGKSDLAAEQFKAYQELTGKNPF